MARQRTIDSWLETHATHLGDRPALSFDGRTQSYGALRDRVDSVAAMLAEDFGLKRGDRLAFYGKNSADEVACMFASARLGLIFVPLNWRLAASELAYVVGNCQASLVLHDAEFAAQAGEVAEQTGVKLALAETALPQETRRCQAPEADISDPFLLVYTSGTTGRPKGAVLTQEAILWNALISVHAHDFTPDDHVLNILPLFHVGGINIQMMPCFFIGGHLTLHAAFDPDATLHALAHEGITTTVCVPTVMKALLYHPDWGDTEFPAFRLMNTGSTDVPVEIIEAVHKRGFPMVQVYGATETGPFATYQKAEEAQATMGSIGRPAAHVQIRLVGEDGIDVPSNQAGEIWVKGPNTFTEYWQNPEATAWTIIDGWVRTGDVARRDENGLYWFADRVKHVVISGGENIYPAELERILNRIEGVVEGAVVGRPHPKWGEVPVAVVVTGNNGPDRAEILAAFHGEIARYKQPKDVVFVDELPRNAFGKVVASEVRVMIAEVSD